MTTYRFTVEVSGLEPNPGAIEDRFYGNGVDDALIYASQGRLFLAFDREAPDEEKALFSATDDIIKRGGGVVRIMWDEPRTSP